MTKTIKIENLPTLRKIPSKNICDYLAEGAAICLKISNHPKGVELSVEGAFEGKLKLDFEEVNQAVLDSWADLREATEAGATCLALWIIEQFTDLKVIRRSFQSTGFDYWLGKKQDIFPFKDAARLEVSGLLNESIGRVNQRMKEKIAQVEKSSHTKLPAYIIVIEFSQPLAKTTIV